MPDEPDATISPTISIPPTFIPPTATDEILEPTATDTTPEPTPTEIESPTLTPTNTATITPENTNTPIPEPTKTATELPYTVQANTPAYITNFAHPTKGCDWIGVAGQVFGQESSPVMNIVAVVTGVIGVDEFEAFGVTGTEGADVYGPGGYEVVIGNAPFTSTEKFTIQLFDIDGVPISNDFTFNTFNDCSKNLIIINFSAIE